MSHNDSCSVRSASSTTSSASKNKSVKANKTPVNYSNTKRPAQAARKLEVSINTSEVNNNIKMDVKKPGILDEPIPSSSTPAATMSTADTEPDRATSPSEQPNKCLSALVTDLIDGEFGTRDSVEQKQSESPQTDAPTLPKTVKLSSTSSPLKQQNNYETPKINDSKNFNSALFNQYFMVFKKFIK
jgi:hypothetical protein